MLSESAVGWEDVGGIRVSGIGDIRHYSVERRSSVSGSHAAARQKLYLMRTPAMANLSKKKN